jgi:hypothetical protein
MTLPNAMDVANLFQINKKSKVIRGDKQKHVLSKLAKSKPLSNKKSQAARQTALYGKD